MIYFSTIARVWLGSMFFYTAGLKLVWYDRNGCHVKAYQLLHESLAPTVGFLLMFAEFLTGITLFTGWFFPLGPLLGTLLGASFAYASLKVLMRKGDVPCGCAGTSKSRVNWTTLIRALCIVAFCVFVFLFDQRGGVVFQPAAIFLVILISLLPAGLALLNRMRSIRLYRQRVQRDKEEIARLRRLLATQPIQ